MMDEELTPFEKLLVAASNGDCQEIRQIVESGCEVNQFDDVGFSPLCDAIHSYCFDAVKLLLELGADPNLRDEYHNDFSPLDKAIITKARNRKQERIKIVQLLLEYGADPHIRSWMQLNAFDRLHDSHVLPEIKELVNRFR